jgi:flagellar protein FliO/FliZ
MEPVSLFWSFLKMITALAVVLGLMIAVAVLLRKIMGQNVAGAREDTAINILATRYLGPKSSIVIVDILGHILAVGVSAQQITALTDLSGPETREKLRALRRDGQQRIPTFAEQLLDRSDVIRNLSRKVKKSRPPQ